MNLFAPRFGENLRITTAVLSYRGVVALVERRAKAALGTIQIDGSLPLAKLGHQPQPRIKQIRRDFLPILEPENVAV